VRDRLLGFADGRWRRIDNAGSIEKACEQIEAPLRRDAAAVDA
jgi:hypothetical protein